VTKAEDTCVPSTEALAKRVRALEEMVDVLLKHLVDAAFETARASELLLANLVPPSCSEAACEAAWLATDVGNQPT